MDMFTIRHYTTGDKHDSFREWPKKLRDPTAKSRMVRRAGRIEVGSSGDHKPCRGDVWELQIDQGPDYHVYYTMADAVVVLLLRGGDKGTRGTDIERAIGFWKGQ